MIEVTSKAKMSDFERKINDGLVKVTSKGEVGEGGREEASDWAVEGVPECYTSDGG